jgi:hypothetical protein
MKKKMTTNLLTYSGGISASMMFEEMKKKKHDSLRGLGSKDIQERLRIEIEAGRGHFSVCVLNSGVTTASPIKAEADSPFLDKRRYDYHLPPTEGGNTLPKHVSSVLNSLVPGTSTSANSVFIAIRGSNSDEAYVNECILGGVLGTQTGAENRRDEASQSNVIKIGTNFISPGKSEKDPLTLASKLASGELGVKTLAWCMSDQSSQRGAAYLIDRLMENLPEVYPTKESVELLTAKNAYSVFCQFNGQKVAKARAEFLLLDSDTKAAMRDATAAELLGDRDALRFPAKGRFKKAAKKAAIEQGLGRSEARTTAVGAAIEMGWPVRCALRIPIDKEITPEALKASGSVIASEMGLASAAEYRSLVEGDAAGTLTPAEQEKFRLWHEARQAGAAEYRRLVEGNADQTLSDADQMKFQTWYEALQGAGFATAAEYRRLVEGDAAGTFTPAEQEKIRLWHEALQGAGFASASVYRRLVASDAAGTLFPAEQEELTSWRESKIKAGRSGGDNDADLLDATEGFETADGPEEKQIAAEKLANAVAYCEMRHKIKSKTMIGVKKVSNELVAQAREKTNLKTLR